MTRTHYEILGIWRDASVDEIEQRYGLLRDRLNEEQRLGSDEAVDQLATVEDAYSTLSDPARRAAYDATLRTAFGTPANETEEFKTYKGSGGAFQLHSDHLVIVREGVMAKAGGLGATREIPLAAITGVTLKLATRAVNGHLQLQLGGVQPRGHIGDPNSVVFTRRYAREFEELAELLNEQIAKNAARGIDPTEVEFDRGGRRVDSRDENEPLAAVGVESTGALKTTEEWRIWPDRFETPAGTYLLGPDVKASVENDASQQFAPVKFLAFGVLGATRKRGGVWLTVEGDSFHCLGMAPLTTDRHVRNFAANVNAAVKALALPAVAESSGHDGVVPATESPNVFGQIQKLGELRDAGLLTEEEFDAKKGELLQRL